MESGMVAKWGERNNKIIKEFFKKNFPNYQILEETAHGPNWGMKYSKDDITISIIGDIAFYVQIIIDGDSHDLWSYDRTVNEYSKSSSENIRYQLSILKNLLK